MNSFGQSRRGVLHVLGAAISSSLAGCAGRSSDSDSNGTNSLDRFAATQFRGGIQNKGYVDISIPDDVTLSWAVPTNRGEHSATKGSPVTTPAGNIIIADDTGRLRSIDPDGSVRWSTSFTTAGRGSHGTPAIANGTAYISAYDGAVSALDVDTGVIEWQTQLGAAVGASPTYFDGRLYVAVEHSDPSGSVAVLNAGTGALDAWDQRPTDHPHSTVAIDSAHNQLVLGSNDGYCYAWEFPFDERRWKYDTDGDIKTAIGVIDGTAIVPSWAGTVTGIDMSSGTRHWEFQADDKLMCAPAIHDGTAYIGSHDESIYAINTTTGNLMWETQTGGWVTGNAVATPNHLLVGSYDSHLYALDRADGSIVWSFEARGEVTSAPAITSDAIYFTERAKNGQADYPGMLYKLVPR